jgi:uroporphyrinogen-III synthase
MQAGVPEAFIDSPSVDAAQFDSEALWQRVSEQVQVGKPVLIVRGQDVCDGVAVASDALSNASSSSLQVGTGRDWLAQQLQVAGASAQFLVTYERRAPVWSAEQMAQAYEAATNGSVWLLQQFARHSTPRGHLAHSKLGQSVLHRHSSTYCPNCKGLGFW